MSLADQFEAAVAGAFAKGGGATFDLLPMVIARAAVSVLPVDGAGVSMIDHLRIPLAASDQHVMAAERLQITIGDGPCLAAAAGAEPLVADLAVMATRWPTYHERLVAETPYRSLASLPLPSSPGPVLGALDLYSTRPETLTGAALQEINAGIAIPITGMLFAAAAPGVSDGTTLPNWMSGEQVEERMNVWVAIGMSMAFLNLSNDDALALLRGYAYSHSLTLDQVARLLTDRGLQPGELLT
jgi:hypothetical protein